MAAPDTPISNPEQELLLALERLWLHFGKGKGDRRWSDMLEEMARAAESKGVRGLSEAEYLHLSWHAMCWTYAEKHTIQYFLPRLAADMSQGTLRDIYPEMVIRSLVACQWQVWPESEASAVRQWLHAWWKACLTTHPVVHRPANVDYRRCSQVLQLICLAGLDPTPFLQEWDSARTPEAEAQLVSLVDEVEGRVVRGERLWHEVREGQSVDEHLSSAVVAWLTSPEQIARLRRIATTANDADDATLINYFADRLEQHDW